MPLEIALQEGGLRPPTDVHLRLPSGMHLRSTCGGLPTKRSKLPAAFGRTPSSQPIRVHSSNCNLKVHCERAAFGRPPGSRRNRRAVPGAHPPGFITGGWPVTPAGEPRKPRNPNEFLQHTNPDHPIERNPPKRADRSSNALRKIKFCGKSCSKADPRPLT